MVATVIGVIGVAFIAIAAIAAAMTIVLVIRDASAIAAAKDYVLIAATSVGTLGGFLTGYVKGSSDAKKESSTEVFPTKPWPESPNQSFQVTSITEKEVKE